MSESKKLCPLLFVQRDITSSLCRGKDCAWWRGYFRFTSDKEQVSTGHCVLHDLVREEIWSAPELKGGKDEEA